MPQSLQFRRSFVNVRNKDLKCFLWSILAQLHPADHHHADRVSNYEQYENEVNMEGIEYPVNLSDIDKFENQNPDISISVFVLNNNSLKVTPIRVAETIRKTHIRLGLLTGENGELHYFLIKNLSGFVGSQINRRTNRKLFCKRAMFKSIQTTICLR